MIDKTTIRLSAQDRKIIQAIANKLKISQSDIIRIAIRKLAESEGLSENSRK